MRLHLYHEMAFLFGGRGRQKPPTEIARALKDLLHRLWEPTVNPKVEEDAAKYMSQMKLIVQGTPGRNSNQTCHENRPLTTLQKLIAVLSKSTSSFIVSYKKTSSLNWLEAYDSSLLKPERMHKSSFHTSFDSNHRTHSKVILVRFHTW